MTFQQCGSSLWKGKTMKQQQVFTDFHRKHDACFHLLFSLLKTFSFKGLSKWTRVLNDEAPVCQQFVLFLACWSHSCESFKYWSLLFCVLSYLDLLGESWGMHLANVAGQGGQKSCALTDDGCSNVAQDGSRRNKVFLFEKWCVNISCYCTLGQRRFIFANSSESSFSESGSLLNLTLLFIF